ncbi:hypothetical protein GLOIN_2v1884262 [Rhizophagus clarus]|uniref:Uncharacterized protein n=1 Tax=Rhizophagus clarus TaxID=94130 RepID=A0A8H3L8T0_9GLOM|nr:hypothetical protein GLOIN_2v1884262 [Rhizophagus clarus]
MNNIRDIGVNVTADKQRLFLIQAKVDDFRIINCPDQSLSGNLLSNEKFIAITVPVATETAGNIVGVLIKQHHDEKSNKSVPLKT